MDRLVALLPNSERAVQETIVCTFGSAAHAAGEVGAHRCAARGRRR
jgi:hypothetical protein